MDNALAETDDQDELHAVYTNEPQQYGNLISQYRKGPTLWLPSYYHYDALGSTRALTDGAGDLAEVYLYDAWGNELAVTGTTVNPFRWVGQVGYYWDEGTGTFYIRARVYEPVIGRWMSQDPLFYPACACTHWRTGSAFAIAMKMASTCTAIWAGIRCLESTRAALSRRSRRLS